MTGTHRRRDLRNSVFARLLAGTVLAVLLAQLAGVTHVLAERSDTPRAAWQGAADAAARTLVEGLDAHPPEDQRAEILARASSRGWRAQVVARGVRPEPPPGRRFPPPPYARVTLAGGDDLVVDAPGWKPTGFTIALAAQILLSVAGVGGVVYLLGRPLARDLDRIRDTLQRIGNEELSSRVGPLRTRDVAPVGSAIDVMADRVEALVTAQRELLQTVSHELRTPHARLRFRLEHLATAADGTARAELLVAIEQDLDEVDALLSELLAYVRVDGQVEPRLGTEADTEAELADWLVDVVERADLGDTDAEVVLEVPPGVPLPRAPRSWFDRAIGNLVRNARRHARTRVEVRARVVSDGHLEVTVDDDGPGFAPGDRERVVQPFEIGGSPGSVGLGLAITSRVLVRAGGTLQLDTSPDGGARVRTTWPV